MKLEKKAFILVLLLALATASTALVYAMPQMPHQFWGDVWIDGSPAPDGTLVEAKIDGVTYLSTTTVGGQYGYAPLFKVPADDPDTHDIEGGYPGDYVDFYVDGFYAGYYLFARGSSTWVDLEVTTSVYELYLYEGWNLIGLPYIPADPSIEVVLSDILYYVDSVLTYDAYTGYWYSYSPYAPSDLTTMSDGKGYWIKVWADVIWQIDIE